jgi:hypothetical protein
VIISTAGNTPGSLADLVCAATSFDDVETDLLPALADDLDADSAGFYQAIRDGDAVRLGHSVVTHGVGPEPTSDPVPNTGHIVVVGSPQGGWRLTDWDGTPR